MDTYRVLSPIWTIRRETAQRVRQRIKSVLDWSKVAGFRMGENAVNDPAKALPKARPEAKHHKALPYRDAPAFIVSLESLRRAAEISDGGPFLFPPIVAMIAGARCLHAVTGVSSTPQEGSDDAS